MQQGFFARGHDDSPLAVGGPAQVHLHEWSAVTYNTLSCKPDRLRHILHELRYNRFVGLQGTNRRAKSHEPAVTQSRVGKYIVFDFPSRGGIFPSKGAGVIVALHRSAFSETNVVKVFVPPDDFSGRIGGVRVKRRDVDFCVFSVYIPVEPRTAAERRKLDKIWRYLHWLIEQLPSRCVPIVLCDANGRTGSVPSQGIGHANPQRENHNGSQLRKLLDTQHLAAINTFFPVGHTWRGSMGISSRIDYVLLPTATHIHSCRILHNSARELQVIPAPGWRDHKPVQVVFHHALGYVGVDQTEPIRWDRDAMAQCLMYGTDRGEFVTAVEAACSEPHMLSPTTSVDQKWHRLNGTITKIAQRFFHQTNWVHRKHPQDTQDAFHTMVAARTQLVKQPEHRIFGLDPGSGSPMHEDLRVLLQRWNVLTKFRITRRQHDQLCARDRLSRDMALVDEFTGYWQKRQMANVWRTARQLSGKALGPKRRRFDVPLCSQPSKQDWEHFFSQDGPSGGCSALPCNMESRLSVETPSLEPAVKNNFAKLCHPGACRWKSGDSYYFLHGISAVHGLALELAAWYPAPRNYMLSCLNSSQTFVLTTRHHWLGKPAWGIKSTRATKKKDVQGSEWLTVWIRLARPTTRSFGNEETGSRSGIMPVDTAAESQELTQWYNSTWLAIGFERTGNRMASVFWMWQMLSIAHITHVWIQQSPEWLMLKTLTWCNSVTRRRQCAYKQVTPGHVCAHGLARCKETHQPLTCFWKCTIRKSTFGMQQCHKFLYKTPSAILLWTFPWQLTQMMCQNFLNVMEQMILSTKWCFSMTSLMKLSRQWAWPKTTTSRSMSHSLQGKEPTSTTNMFWNIKMLYQANADAVPGISGADNTIWTM